MNHAEGQKNQKELRTYLRLDHKDAAEEQQQHKRFRHVVAFFAAENVTSC